MYEQVMQITVVTTKFKSSDNIGILRQFWGK